MAPKLASVRKKVLGWALSRRRRGPLTVTPRASVRPAPAVAHLPEPGVAWTPRTSEEALRALRDVQGTVDALAAAGVGVGREREAVDAVVALTWAAARAAGNPMASEELARAAGSAAALVEGLLEALPWERPVALAEVLLGVALTGLAWGELAEGRRAWTHALGWLDRHAAGRTWPDGVPIEGGEDALLTWVERALALRRLAVDEGLELPTGLTDVVGRASCFLGALAHPFGELPGSSAAPEGAAAAAYHAALHLGWVPGKPGAGSDTERERAWSGETLVPVLPGDSWTLRVFRSGGWAIGTATLQKRLARAVIDLGGGGSLGVDLVVGGHPLVLGAEQHVRLDGVAPDRLERAQVDVLAARVDGREARARAEHQAFPGRRGLRRDVRLRQSRLSVLDTPLVDASTGVYLFFPLGRGLTVEAEPVVKGERFAAGLRHVELGAIKLALDGRLHWRLAQTPSGELNLEGSGTWRPGEVPLATRIEWT